MMKFSSIFSSDTTSRSSTRKNHPHAVHCLTNSLLTRSATYRAALSAEITMFPSSRKKSQKSTTKDAPHRTTWSCWGSERAIFASLQSPKTQRQPTSSSANRCASTFAIPPTNPSTRGTTVILRRVPPSPSTRSSLANLFKPTRTSIHPQAPQMLSMCSRTIALPLPLRCCAHSASTSTKTCLTLSQSALQSIKTRSALLSIPALVLTS
mmetsp:Transcript_2637/g.4503  ORF Transcript_2637/g.4503 Transcript_2637/m.4503 type:complete len:209 (-) Transcript_2637:486-1112(-)